MTSRAIQAALDALEIDGGMTYLENEPLENVLRIPLYRESYVLVMRRGHPASKRATITWKDAAAQRLCLLSEDMQNRRIIDKLAASIGVRIRPQVVSNSFVGIFSYLHHGEWMSIVPHTFAYVFAGMPDLIALDLVEPVHTQTIGLVLSARAPLSPMANALLALLENADLEASLGASAIHLDTRSLSNVRTFSLD